MSDIVERLKDEADLCINDGADDCAALIDEAAETILALRQDVAIWKGEAADRSEGLVNLNLDRAAMSVTNMKLRETLEWYADQMCEGWCEKDPRACESIGRENCAGCPARAALSTTEAK